MAFLLCMGLSLASPIALAFDIALDESNIGACPLPQALGQR
jgi:hypothetical protein